MESFEFLGGRYNRPEQIMSGAVQAFKAQHAGNGRTVFIHRVSTSEAPHEQATLLKLLTTAIIKSPDAQRLVLDFGEERGYWYVVTESEPQCALLREWLQLEIDAAMTGGKAGNEARPSASKPAIYSAPAAREDESPGEFTRFLQSKPQFNPPAFARSTTPRPPASQPSSTGTSTADQPITHQPMIRQPIAGPTTNRNINAPAAQDTQHVPAEPFKGEFTQMFQRADNTGPATEQTKSTPAPQASSVPVASPTVEAPPGEFTSLFHPAQTPNPLTNVTPVGTTELPAPKGKSDAPAATPPPGEFTSLFNPPSSAGSGSQPLSKSVTNQPPPAALPAKGAESGEFTRFFSGGLPPSASKPVTNPSVTRAERPSNPYVQRSNTISSKTYAPPAAANKSTPESGEFTRMFSSPSGAPQRPERVAYKADRSEDALPDMFSNRIDIPQPIAPSQPSEGEFTRMFGGGSQPTPVTPQAAVGASPQRPLVDDRTAPGMKPTQELAAPVPPSIEQGGPSEFTRIMQGGYSKPADSPATEQPSALGSPVTGAPSAGGASPIAVPGVSIQQPVLPKVHVAKPAVPKTASAALGAAEAVAPAANAKNKKLIIFLSILIALAIVLVIVMAVATKK